ncbi:MAG TPA: VanZ family protein [Mariprofundaceae bacterium]|nr:VanZ family protein [Mariprofundaceae bacterium]
MRILHPALLLSWCLLIFWLSSRPVIPTPLLFEHQDKLFHAASYAVMGWLFWRWGQAAPAWPASRTVALGLLFCSLYGASDEWHQSFVPARDASTGDWLADTLGAVLMFAVLHWRAVAAVRARG